MKLVRIWSERDLSSAQPDDLIKMTSKQVHYIQNVMRRKIGDMVLVFNRYEWIAELTNEGTKLREILRSSETIKPISVAIACIKKPRMELFIEKATEIGVSEIFLLETEYTQPVRYSFSRLESILIEASEQCGRLELPKIHEPIKLKRFLDQNPMKKVLCHNGISQNKINYTPDTCVMIGPEGGWSENELSLMHEIPTFCFNDNILRSETAAIVALGIMNYVML